MQAADGVPGKQALVTVGRIGGIYGVAGWVRIVSYTRPVTNIFSYTPWLIGDGDQQQPGYIVSKNSLEVFPRVLVTWSP